MTFLNQHKNKIIILSVLILCVIMIYSIILYNRNKLLKDDIIIKSALHDWEIEDKPYILVKEQSTTGPIWVRVDGFHFKEECKIVGADPYSDFNFNGDFYMANNTFILYVESVEEYFDQELGYSYPQYNVKENWDILYPVKRDEIEKSILLAPYITEGDIQQVVE